MVLSRNKNFIFEGLMAFIRNVSRLITVNYRTYIVLRTFSTVLIGLIMSISLTAQSEYRSIDGSLNHPLGYGAAHDEIDRKTDVSYLDGISIPGGVNRENARIISNRIFAQDDRIDNGLNLSDFVWSFGQFLDHDISFVKDSETEPAFIPVIESEETFEVGDVILMSRSEERFGTGTDVTNPRQYTNVITSFIDASMVYGSDEARAEWLRDQDSQIGKLKVSSGNLLPWNTVNGEISGSTADPNIPEMDNEFDYTNKNYVAGDVRANENPLLIALHTVFVREHNRLCDVLFEENPGWSSDKIYEEARKRVGAIVQAITYYEWLPSQGIYLPEYQGYSEDMEPRVLNVFSAAAFRMGHTLINQSIVRMEDDGDVMSVGNVDLRDAYFNPTLINIVGGIEPYLKGMASNLQQDFDCKMIDDLRNFLFQTPGAPGGGLDLAAININRGRERGLPDYNTVRFNFGLPRLNDFYGITGEQESADLLEEVYGDINDVDPWVGMLAEEHEQGALVGKLVMTILERQFQLLRDGDRFYFENDPVLSPEEIEAIKVTTLHDVIMRNTDISLMQDEVFEAMPHEDIPNGAALLPLHLEANLYPNPTKTDFTIKYYLEIEEVVNVEVFNSNGQLLSTNDYTGTLGNNFIPFSLPSEYPRGVYNIKLETSSSYKILRIVKD